MTDIFISYASEDRERARQIATALGQNGWSVWWDRQIPFGKSFDKVIEENLAKARCVIVLWTKHSVESRWVRAEASEGVGRELLLPVLLERDLKLPLEFKMFQAANLADWHPDEPHEEFQRLLKSIALRLGAAPASPTTAGQNLDDRKDIAAQRGKKSKKALYLLGLMILPSVIIVALALGLMNWRIPTRVQIDLVVDRVAFSIAGSQPVAILDRAASFQSLSVESFASVSFKPATLAIAESSDGPEAKGEWHGLAGKEVVVLRGRKEDLPIVTIMQDDGAAGPAGRLEAITADPGTQVIMETVGGAGLTLRLDGQSFAPAVLPLGTFRLHGARVVLESNSTKPVTHNLIAMRAELAPDNPLIDMRGLPQSLVLTLTPVKNSSIELLSKTGAPIRDIELTRQNQSGAREPSLVATGEIRYPDFPAKDKITIDPHDFLGLDRLDRFFITQLGMEPDGKQLRIGLAGVAGHIQTLTGAAREDRRLTRFDTLWYGSKPAVLFSILVWVISVTLGAFKLYKEFKQ